MSESTVNPVELGLGAAIIDLPAWKKIIGTTSAVLLALLFFTSGAWKLSDPFKWAQVLGEFKVPTVISLPFTIALGIGETLGAVLILVPRFRRWGSWLLGFLLLSFMLYIGANYGALAGKECSCFPLVKRTVGPAFFAGDMTMLVMAALAGWWVRRSENLRGALVILGAVAVFAGVSFGVNSARETGLKAPDSITVDGKPFSLQEGNVFLFFYDPTCPHCEAAARKMAKFSWKDTKIVAIPTEEPQFAASFLHDTGLQAGTSNDLQPLRGTFQFVNSPYGVALERGRQKATFSSFEENNEPDGKLRQLGFIQ